MMMLRFRLCIFSALLLASAPFASAGERGLVDTVDSPHAQLYMVDLDDVHWTEGFWADRFETLRTTMVPFMWDYFNNLQDSHAWANFLVASGTGQGRNNDGKHHGAAFNDGDLYKWFESLVNVYAQTHDPVIDKQMDEIITVIARAQRADGYLHTKTIIEQHNAARAREAQADSKAPAENLQEAGSAVKATTEAMAEPLLFEAYNMGHLMTAACLHHRVTGKTNFLDVAIKVADYLDSYYAHQSPEGARSAICPAHYMGMVEMYRTTGDPRYDALARKLIEVRSEVRDGTDDNQDRVPFREMDEAVGHAVRANYLYAGVADVFAESGDKTLMDTLHPIWRDVVYQKLYITGGTGALYDGVSPYGSGNYAAVQRTHQAYGYDYQLPNITAYNETCANIGSLLWNWRMMLAEPDVKYADLVELTLYNAVLPAIDFEGKKYFYVNPLRTVEDLSVNLRWTRTRRTRYGSFCCPPNILRTLSEAQNYSYTLSKNTLWFQLYASNELDTQWAEKDGGGRIHLRQTSGFPFDGNVKLVIEEAPARRIAFKLRIPGWVDSMSSSAIRVNGRAVRSTPKPGHYFEIERKWKAGDTVEIEFPMQAQMIEAHHKLEESRNQVAIRRGPLIYCVEELDLPKGTQLENAAFDLRHRDFKPVEETIDGVPVVALKATGLQLPEAAWSDDQLYRPLPESSPKPLPITLIPYFAWDNRGESPMSVWLPVR